jgi:hypothetical protein
LGLSGPRRRQRIALAAEGGGDEDDDLGLSCPGLHSADHQIQRSDGEAGQLASLVRDREVLAYAGMPR